MEKPKSSHQIAAQKILGCYLLNRKFIDLLEKLPTEQYNFETALDQLLQKSPLPVLSLANFLDLKYPWHLFDFQKELLAQQSSYTHPEAQVAATAILDDSQGPIYIAAGVKIGDFAKIVGPAYIGPSSLVGDYSFVRESSIEGWCRIGANTELVRSLVFSHVDVHSSYIADSILGSGSHAGAGLITANLRLDEKNVQTMVKGELVDTGRRKLGIITGAKANLGIRVSTMPGVLIGAETVVYPQKMLSRNLAHRSVEK